MSVVDAGESLGGLGRLRAEAGGSGRDGYVTTKGGKMLDPMVPIDELGLGDMVEVVFHDRLRGGGFGNVLDILHTVHPVLCRSCTVQLLALTCNHIHALLWLKVVLRKRPCHRPS